MSDSEYSYGWESLDEEEKRKTTEPTTKKNSDKKLKRTSTIQVKLENLNTNGHTFKEEKYSSESDEHEESDNNSVDMSSSNHNRLQRKSANSSTVNNHSPEISGRSMKNSLGQKYNIDKKSLNDETVLNQYLKTNTHLNIVSTVGITDIGDDNDLWLVQCPHNLNLNMLQDIDLLQKKKRIKLDGTSFECVSLENNKEMDNITLITHPATEDGDFKILSHNLNGTFVLREKLKDSYDVEVVYEETEKTPFPDGLKKRHPLFGVKYKNMLKLSSKVVEKLKNPACLKEKSKKRRANIEEDHNEITTKTPKKRKRKAENLVSCEDQPFNKIKKEPTDMWTSETSIEKNLFELPVKTIKKE